MPQNATRFKQMHFFKNLTRKPLRFHSPFSGGILALVLLLASAAYSSARGASDSTRSAYVTSSASVHGVAGPLPDLETASHDFQALLDLNGNKLADGEFKQWLENQRLHVKITYDFGPQRRAEENSVFRLQPGLVEEQWSWIEFRNGQIFRKFEADFRAKKSESEKREKNDFKRWSDSIKVESGHTFAGFGFVLAIKTFRERLMHGEKIELQAVAFTPKTRVVTVVISYSGLETIEMAHRMIKGDGFVIHPRIPLVARPFIEVHDTRIWLTP